MLATALAYTFGMGLATAALVVWIFVWILVAVRVLRRHDIGAGGKILWLLVILLLPVVGFLSILGPAAASGALFALGATLRPSALAADKRLVGATVAAKLLLLPAIAWLGFALVPVPGEFRAPILLTTALPTAASVFVMKLMRVVASAEYLDSGNCSTSWRKASSASREACWSRSDGSWLARRPNRPRSSLKLTMPFM